MSGEFSSDYDVENSISLHRISRKTGESGRAGNQVLRDIEPLSAIEACDGALRVIEPYSKQILSNPNSAILQNQMNKSVGRQNIDAHDQTHCRLFGSSSDAEAATRFTDVPIQPTQDPPIDESYAGISTPHLDGIATQPSRSINLSEEHNSSPTTQPHASLLHWWYLDIIAAATSLASLAAIIGVLLAYDGKSQEEWASDVLTINGLVAILATVCRGTFMTTVASILSQEKWNRFSGSTNKFEDFVLFDEASRGLLGSLRLLWRFKAT
jgi:hypothetical protein